MFCFPWVLKDIEAMLVTCQKFQYRYLLQTQWQPCMWSNWWWNAEKIWHSVHKVCIDETQVDNFLQEYSMIMSERDSVHKEIEKLQDDVSNTNSKMKEVFISSAYHINS